jgi:colanic acid biosynthesis glycosyl transferase WcaI
VKLLVVTNLFHPDRGGGASVFSDLCFGLVERGHDVTVYTTYPYYPEWRNKSRSSQWKVTEEYIRGVRVRRFGVFLARTPGSFAQRATFELSFAASLGRSLASRRKYDAVMVFCPLLGSVGYSALRRLLFREPIWLNVQDIPADAAEAGGIASGRAVRRLGRVIQGRLFNTATVWSTIAPEMMERLAEVRRRQQPILLMPNFLHESMEVAIRARPQKVGRTPSRPVRLLYAGTIGRKQQLLEFCRRLSAVPMRFEFMIHGDGGEAAGVRDWVAGQKDDRFRFGAFLEEGEFVDALFRADMFVVTEIPGAGASFFPSKLIPCMATGTPLLSVCDREGPLGREVSEFGLGLSIEWREFSELVPRLEALLASDADFSRLQRNALERAVRYARVPVIDDIERAMVSLVRV